MALYGHEISEEINVFEAGLERFCKLERAALSAPRLLERSNRWAVPRASLPALRW